MASEPEKPKASEPLDQDITAAPEMFEQRSTTDDQAREAYQAGDMEKFNAWLTQQQERAGEDPTGMGHFYLEIRLANIQVAAGEQAEAAERLQDTYSNVWQEIRAVRQQGPAAGAQEDLARRLAHLDTTKEGLKIRFRQLTGLELDDDDAPPSWKEGNT